MSLEGKYQKYLELLSMVQEPKTGFIEWHECDSLLFSGLVGCVPEVTVDIMAAYDKKTNQWLRKPRHLKPPCYNPQDPRNVKSRWQRIKDSYAKYKEYKAANQPVDWDFIAKKVLVKKGSTISRDMLTGLAWYAWHNKRLDISEGVIRKALTNWGVMGEGDLSRINIMPGLFATFCWISYRLGGPSRAWARWIPDDAGTMNLDGYAAHLQVLHILLRSELAGKLPEKNKAVLNYHASREPKNPLFLHAIGEDLRAMEILLDEKLWPSNRLPMKADRKEAWLLQRDYGSDWKGIISSTEGFHHHSGGDFLFMWWLINKKYEIKT